MTRHHRFQLLLSFILSSNNSKLSAASYLSPVQIGPLAGNYRASGNRQPLASKGGVTFPSSPSWHLSPQSPRSFHPSGHKSKKRIDDDAGNGAKDETEDKVKRFNPEQIDPLEIRLDATLLTIYVLCRFLVYDVTTGVKQTPGWELHDVIMILQTFSSAIVLSGFWTLAGVLVTGIFDYDDDDDNEAVVWKDLLMTAVVSAPLWVVIEIALGWPTAGVFWRESLGGTAVGSLGADTFLVGSQDSLWYLFTLIGTGTLGVGCVMAFGRYARKYIA